MSFGELLFLAILALLVFGPRKLPEIARQMAKIMAELRKASNEFRYQLEDELHNMEVNEAKQKRLEPGTPPSVDGTVAREDEDRIADDDNDSGEDGAREGETEGVRGSVETPSSAAAAEAVPPADELVPSRAVAVPWDEEPREEADARSWEAAVYERDLASMPAEEPEPRDLSESAPPGQESGAASARAGAPDEAVAAHGPRDER